MPLYTPRMPRSGKPLSVRMTNCGVLGWISDEKGYRYQPAHPETGKAWPPTEACLINLSASTARMGLHQGRHDEEDFDASVVSRSLDDTCLFHVAR